MAGYLSTVEIGPSISNNSSFLQEPPSPYSTNSNTNLREQTSFTGLVTEKDYQFYAQQHAPPKKSPFKIFFRNRFTKAFADHPENPTIPRRIYGLFHGHSFETSNYVKKGVTGWRIGLRWAAFATFLAFVANSIYLIVTMKSFGNVDGMATLYSGNCNTVANYDTFIHILINVVSTVLLGASSYVMQCLNSPSREQVDRAHAQGKSMDIGMPSFKNARRVGWKQTSLWLTLGLSALPLHIFWNSSVFATLEANQFDMFIAPPDFNTTDFACDLIDGCDNAETLWKKSRTGQLEYLDNAACINAYSTNFLAGRRNVLAITSNTTRGWQENTTAVATSTISTTIPTATAVVAGRDATVAATNSTIWGVIMSRKINMKLAGKQWHPTYWWCSNSGMSSTNSTFLVTTNWYNKVVDDRSFASLTCSQSKAIANAKDLLVLVQPYQARNFTSGQYSSLNYGYNIDYCLSERVPEVCQLQSANYVWLIVICCNAIKMACMLLASRALGSNTSPLVVVGDAVSSFLETPDKVTENNCLLSARLARKITKKPAPVAGRAWKHTKPFWLMSSTRWSWIKTFSICTFVLVTVSTTLSLVGAWSPSISPSWQSLPFGGVSPSTILEIQFPADTHSFSTLMQVLLFVNFPQIIFSSLYFMYNSLLTSMLAMQEFSRFAYRRRTLRVSAPVGKQRYTYWLQLPYMYSFPLLTASGVMHWFISQSLFLARVQVIDEYGVLMQETTFSDSLFTLPGYSPKAVICTLVLGGAMVIVIFGLGFRRHPGGVPFVANDSLAISATCHPIGEAADMSTMPLMWGAVQHQVGDVPGHCSFSAREVEPPVVGQLYK